jgi:hypothetical protein
VCAGLLDGKLDIIIADQVFEHLLWPYPAVRNVLEMFNPIGYFLITTPFLVRIHGHPIDCSRWTELGIRHLLAEGGFDIDRITTGSWGNQSCVRSNFLRWTPYNRWLHSLRNEPDYPIVVWALARPVQRIAAADLGFGLEEHDLDGEPDPEGALQRLVVEESRGGDRAAAA